MGEIDEILAANFNWCKFVARRESDYPIDRDDLLSAAMEALWLAIRFGDENIISYARAIFFGKKSKLWAKHKRRTQYVDFPQMPLDHPNVLNVRDIFSAEPWLYVAAAEVVEKGEYARPRAPRADCRQRCVACGTEGGAPFNPKQPESIRVKGMCSECYHKKRREGASRAVIGRTIQ